ncbi:MAG: hypothetical protein ACE5K7_06030, partial [Phycisphaerae bacterium]
MARFSLRRYEDQATASLILSIAGLLLLIPLSYLVFRHFSLEQRWIWYSEKTARKFLVLLSGAASGGLGLLGFGLGINSAGQRRNIHSRRSWLGFFL